MENCNYTLYGERYDLVDYKITRGEFEVLKEIMIKNIDKGNTIIFSLSGDESELNNLGIKSSDAIISKVFNNLISNERFFYNNVLNNDIALIGDIYTSTGIYVLGDRKFNELKDYKDFKDNLKKYEFNYTCLEYDETSNSLLKAKFIK